MERLVLSILVDNTPGVLNRVAGLFSRRSYNIDSLTVGETNDPHISRMTVVSTGDAETLEQIEKQVRKLEDVKEVFKLEDTNSVYRELVLIKVECSHKERVDIVSIVDIYRGKIVDVSPDSMVIEITGTQSKIDGLLAMMTDFNVTEIVRTGIAGIGRGLRDEDKEKIKAR
ncbi:MULTISPECIES: acetolactate synthase small subunit [Sharpea]|uniref:Acetolactate synthase small subunit n=1 Tax=Sharpea azabuensis TaxID=322505 RepID=A0A1H6QTN0_9FIRM|nr:MULTISPECIES: acetolactate synthase small subunit [Sharpea]HAJ14842.1 acetolactate synthase small subunit [Erysipelotrichaceae bacterium]MDD6513195.1 acetolactate synthase small subunit [Sharpea azabuensis]MDD6712110.1 acetolactate synthase small subunit [Sharpea porci]MEE3307684.1 acetolactate synthase small subunit [Sharpea azabuensis]SEI47051.1 acetolactate synthase, small subunit [Sharpea azabuensis]